MLRRLKPRAQPRPIKDLTEEERQAFFAGMRARTAAMLAERTVPKPAEPAADPAATDQQSDP